MDTPSQKFKLGEMIQHETKRNALIRFALVLILFVGYFAFIAFRYGLENGFLVTAGTWSFFVLCTPVADAGFLLDFPLRLIVHLRMFYSELIVWCIAIGFNIVLLFNVPEVYEHTKLLSLFKHILIHPIPLWSIICVSALGTFLSVKFGDELIDSAHHTERSYYHKKKKRHRWYIMIFIFILLFVMYDFLLKYLGIDLSTL